jgi:hypothetical protein
MIIIIIIFIIIIIIWNTHERVEYLYSPRTNLVKTLTFKTFIFVNNSQHSV